MPITRVLLPALKSALPGLRYIHVVRNGLDMAFSANVAQAWNWSFHFGLSDRVSHKTPMPDRARGQLRFWTRANQTALDYGASHMDGRFLLMSYDAFCTDLPAQWPRLMAFLDRPAGTPLPSGLVEPRTIGRHGDHDLGIFSAEDLAEARALQSRIVSSAAAC